MRLGGRLREVFGVYGKPNRDKGQPIKDIGLHQYGTTMNKEGDLEPYRMSSSLELVRLEIKGQVPTFFQGTPWSYVNDWMDGGMSTDIQQTKGAHRLSANPAKTLEQWAALRQILGN